MSNPAALTVTTPLGADKITLVSFHGEDGVSELFEFHLGMVSTNAKHGFDTMIGKAVSVTALTSDGGKRYFHGLVTRFSQAGYDAHNYYYMAEVRPWLWMLTHTTDCRIFQKLSVPDVIKKIFKDLGFTDVKDSLTKTYEKRDYIVQYNETSFNFVSRLMEDEGIFYYFTHETSKHTLVLADDADGFGKCPGLKEAKYKQAGETAWSETDIVTECELSGFVTTDSCAQTDYNFETPSTSLMATVKGKTSARRRYEYPGAHAKKAAGETRAKLRLEEQEWGGRVLSGSSLVRSFTAGHTFKLTKHFRADLNSDYVLLRTTHRWSVEGGYYNGFTAIPKKTPYRSPRTAHKAIIPGTQTAVVVGPSGKEIWTDKYGRIKVQFHWDQEGKKDENSSCWIRVAHNWAGKQWGTFFLPRIGMEVVVSFLDGNPDYPLVTAAVYNAQQTVPYALPDNQTRSVLKTNSSAGGDGFNELRFEDKKGEEELWVHAEKDMNIKVKNDRSKIIEANEVNEIKKNRKITVTDNQDLIVSKGNRSVDVQTGTEDHKVKGTRTIEVTGDETHTDKAKFNHNVDGDYTLKIKGNLVIDVTGTVTFKTAKSFTAEAGTDFAQKAGKTFTNKSGTSFTNEAGTDLTNKAGTELTNKSGTDLTNQSGTGMTNKAGTTMNNEAGVSLTSKGALHTVEASGIMTVKGAMVKIN